MRNGFAIRGRTVIGTPNEGIFYEAMVYAPTPDLQYDFETCFAYGSYAAPNAAQAAVDIFCRDNPKVEVEKIINRCTADKKVLD